MGNNAATGTGGAGGHTSAGVGGQGGGETATATGDVVRVDNLAFDTATAYTKPAFIKADGLGGKELGQPYDGTTFTIPDVAAGAPWFLVTPNNTLDTVFPTYSRQNIPANKLTLPLLDRDILASIANDAGLALSTLAAQIVVRVTRSGKTLQGISAVSPGKGLILYVLGPSSYSIQNKLTGDRGVIVLLNQATNAITLVDTKQTPNLKFNLDVRAVEGTATLIEVDLPL
jgi:hypothetical protein